MVRRAGIACISRVTGIGITMMAPATVRVLGWIVGDRRIVRRIFGWWILGWMLVRGLGVFFLRIAIVLLVMVALAIAGIILPRLDGGAIQARIAAIELSLTLIAHLAQGKLLLVFQVTANAGVLAVVVAALGQFTVLAAVEAVDLVIEIVLQFFTRVWQFRLASGKYSRRGQQEGPDYKGVTYPMLLHTSMPPKRLLVWLLDGLVCEF
jgi:hypothetical protein